MERFNRTLEAILSKVVAENQRDWDCHIPKALFAYRTAFHESSGYSPFRVNFGCSPLLPIDIAVGQLNAQVYEEGEEPTVPQYVEALNKSLRKIFSDVREQLASAHDRSKKRYDKSVNGEKFVVGDQVWLFVPAVKQGRTKKLASLWRGPYTVVDRINGALNYRIQLVGSTKTLVVHRNRLKRCYGLPKEAAGQKHKAKTVSRRQDLENQPSITNENLEDPAAESSGAWVEADDEPEARSAVRPQRIRRPPDRYGIYVEH